MDRAGIHAIRRRDTTAIQATTPCPTCNAAPGEACRNTRGGARVGNPHMERRTRYYENRQEDA